MERTNSLQFGDLIDLRDLQKPKFGNVFYTIGGVTEDVKKKVDNLVCRIEDNAEVRSTDLSSFVEVMRGLGVSYFGDDISMDDYLEFSKRCEDIGFWDPNEQLCERLLAGGHLQGNDCDHLKFLPVRVAKVLKKTHGPHLEALWLKNLRKISVELATELGTYEHSLNFVELENLSVEVARELVRGVGHRTFENVKEISKEVARELALGNGEVMTFKSVKQISEEACEELRSYKGELWLYGLKDGYSSDDLLQLLAKNPNFRCGIGWRDLLVVDELRKNLMV